MEISARNINQAYSKVLREIKVHGIPEGSRNGKVLALIDPVLVTYERPIERVLFDEERDANPYFHLLEALWMLAGKNDVAWPAYFNKRMTEFSDDGKVFHAAYGHRWRHRFGFDQLDEIVKLLKQDPDTRRAVLTMWSPMDDLGTKSKDLPCNCQAFFDLRNGELNMTVTNRSNDVVWGMCGANHVQFSVLQEYLAGCLVVPVGVYRHFSNNVHLYVGTHSHLLKNVHTAGGIRIYDPYYEGEVSVTPILHHRGSQEDIHVWYEDLMMFMSDPYGDTAYNTVFFDKIAAPMYASWFDRKTKKNDGKLALKWMPWDSDWKLACEQWIDRKENKSGQEKRSS